MKVPYFKHSITSKEINKSVDVLKSGWLSTGIVTQEFEKKFAKLLMNINKKLIRQGWSYLLFLRVSLVVPSMVVNAACAITSFHIVPFTIISVVATIPVMTIIVYTGELLGSINSLSELYSFNNLLILLSLLFFAFIILIINHFKESQKNKDWM